MLNLRQVPGLPEADLRPPVFAEPGDPFASLRVVHLLARSPRGTPLRVGEIAERLNLENLDWSFGARVVLDAAVQLQSNWMADYRNRDGIVFGSDAFGETVTIEDTPRVDPWMVQQVERLRAECLERLRAFARDEDGVP